MLNNAWTNSGKESITQRVLGRVRPAEPLKNKIDLAQKKLDFQISRMDGICTKLQAKHDEVFEKIVTAQKSNNRVYAQAYAGELAQIRKMKGMIGGAKLSMEQIKLRLDTVSELGDVVVTLSPCMSIIKGLSPSLAGIMPEATASMQDLSQILGDVMSNSSMGLEGTFEAQPDVGQDTRAILEEAHNVIAGKAQTSIPEVPDELRRRPAAKSDLLI